jgi:hypothetical protein
MVTSATARLRPLAPVGGTMCAASPARNSRPCRIGVLTNDRIGRIDFSVTGPVLSSQPSWAKRVARLSQMRSSDQSSIFSDGSTCRYSRDTVGERIEYSANPSGCQA